MSLCILAGGKAATLAAAAFTLSWTHSVEKTEWREEWRATPAGLELVEARIKGSGAGIDPPDGAVLEDGWWVYAPTIAPVPRLVLAASGATVSGWTLCADGACLTLGAAAGETVVVEACEKE
ncbi:MAG: DUF1850 domain-containing protein [Aquamicrobium sp.]|uniref:DUF1850 domain-containing protein n=1 Tax=Aquamicrobium sp. TaxID=1872579 RepID=UPI00349E9C71|nr:DUF1850 domain-containing protein [Aquamicrobium sp.]MCO5155421.1 DUF1850 domain-containing protein [Aquamicrobium sp.]